MKAGRLRHRVTFERLGPEIKDPNTGIVTSPAGWVVAEGGGMPLEFVPAEILTGPGRESNLSQAAYGEVTARINTRWFYADELALYKCRIKWVTPSGAVRYYDIRSVETDITGMREWRFKCTGGVNDG